MLDQAFGVRSYDAAAVGFVPAGERVVERFVLGVRPAMDPDRSERRLLKVLRKGEVRKPPELGVVPDGPELPAPERRGFFHRRR